ncbi:C-X-C motif chemokine 9 [Ursus americanus]|uniref:C-X-C motif chemokine 9 isoform X2 n=1 Tax=Ursus maritimus TaxID=29073 RepID=A0A384CAG9_URSMA|nr:C-X-C motif chemokine 9 isoform X2 [Ursus maritimus]XP_045645788.1 C-X-C motif chemokine 9 [Ursus americanus]
MKKGGVPLLLSIIFLTLIGGEGTPTMRNRRCSCITTSQRTIQLKFLKDLKQFAPNSSCEKIEIIATMKNGDQTCLNPDSADVKELIKEWEKQVSQKKKQKKGKRDQKSKKGLKVKKSQRPHPKKTT